MTTCNQPGHEHPWIRPLAYSASVADPVPTPRPVLLRGSCGHVLGVGLVWRRQRYIAWKRHR